MKEIKKQLSAHPDTIVSILEAFDFCKITYNHNKAEIRCARDMDGNQTSISIKTDTLYCTDFARNINADLIGLIIKERCVTFVDVLNEIKKVLGIDSFFELNKKKQIFGGAYSNLKHKKELSEDTTYDVSILNKYEDIPSVRFLRDNISIETQRTFGIRFDSESQRIIIPIYNVYGELVGVKGRANWNVSDDEPKYLYLLPCRVGQTLFGYHYNYKYLSESDTIYVFEAEKSVMQCYTYNIRNCVAIGSHQISDLQIKKLLEFNPKKIVFMFDEGLSLEDIVANIIKGYKLSSMKDVIYGYWQYPNNVNTKNSPSDYGKERLLEIFEKEIDFIER